MGSAKPICRIAVSLKINPVVSLAISAEKFLPLFTFHETTSSKYGSIQIVPKSNCLLGSFPSHSKLSADEKMLVVGLELWLTCSTEFVLRSSSRSALYCVKTSRVMNGTEISPSREYPVGRFFTN